MLSKMEQKNKNNAGFSLIEVLFAMLFLSVIVFGVIKLQTSNVVLSHTKQLEMKAHFYAAQALEIVEKIKTTGCSSPCALHVVSSNYVYTTGEESLEDGFFKRTIIIEKNPAQLPKASLVSAHVAWTDSAGDHFAEAKRIIPD